MLPSRPTPTGRPRVPIAAALLAGWAALLEPSAVRCQGLEPVPEPVAADLAAGTAVWERLALGALVVGALALLDEPTRELATELRGGFGDDVASFGRWYGDWPKTSPFLVGGLALVGTLADGDRGARRAAAVVAGVLGASFTNAALNHAFGRRRPAEGHGPWRFDPFDGHASLGSGHAAYAFAIAAAIDEAAEGPLSTPFYAAAAITGLSRIYHDRHWLSDVVVGATIGVWMSRRATRTALRAFGVAEPPGTGAGPGSDDAGALGGLLNRLEPVAGARYLGLRLRL